MKILLIVIIGMNLISCGNNPHMANNQPGSTPTVDSSQVEDKEVIKLTATRFYYPDDSEVGKLVLDETKRISLPAKIKVISGNAGNFYSLLAIDNIICYYKGGSDFSYPLQMGNETEISKGQSYHLQFCSLESEGFSGNRLDLQADDSVFVQDSISLSIHNGDSTETTVVELDVEIL